jgi:hypothetical protein
MSTFTHNFTTNHLLFNQPVQYTLTHDDGTITNFELFLPTFRDCTFDPHVGTLLYLLNTPLATLNEKMHIDPPCQTLVGLITKLIDYGQTVQGFQYILSTIQKFIPVIEYRSLLCIDGRPITTDLFQSFADVILVAVDYKKPSDLNMPPQMRAALDRVNAIKARSAANANNNSASNNDFLTSYMILTHEFNYTPEQILNMTIYAIRNILSYTGASISYKVSLIGAGNGLSKKIKFFADKKGAK